MIENGRFNQKEKVDVLMSFLNDSGATATLLETTTYPNFFDIETSLDGRPLLIHANIRNISGAYLRHEPTTRRRQVESLDLLSLPRNTRFSITILVGLSTSDGSLTITFWNAFNFCMHKTVRSCYVSEKALLAAAESGWSFEKYGTVPSWTCKSPFLHETLKDFIRKNATE